MATAARAFCVLALAAPALWAQDSRALPYLGTLTIVWAAASSLQQARWATGTVSIDLAEATLVGVVVGASLDQTLALVGALALPPFIASLRHGFRGTALSLAAQLVSIVVVSIASGGGVTSESSLAVFTWTVTGLGLGLVAGFFATRWDREPDALAPYRDARQLILELLDLSGELSSGLDPEMLAADILDTVLDVVPAGALTVLVPREGELTPIARRVVDPTMSIDTDEALARTALRDDRPQVADAAFAIPVSTDAGVVAVVTGRLRDPNSGRLDLPALFHSLRAIVEPTAIRLDTALLFSSFRDAATADERRRLAREMHDGVAQDIAFMGYLVDALAASPASPTQAEQLQLLRDAITSVVSEVRRSVLTLRSSTEGAESLGAAISGLARHLSAMSGVPILVTVDEQTTRLRPEVEAELLRIAQEAMNNAVKHAQASMIDVECRVDPPFATLIVADNGRGLQGKRSDSHGLEIMHERARLIGADLQVADGRVGGTQVSVQIASEAQPVATTVTREKEEVHS